MQKIWVEPPGKENFDISNEDTSLETSKFSLYFSGSCIHINPKFSYYCHNLHRPFNITRWTQKFRYNFFSNFHQFLFDILQPGNISLQERNDQVDIKTRINEL
jgi:hypothetical protein